MSKLSVQEYHDAVKALDEFKQFFDKYNNEWSRKYSKRQLLKFFEWKGALGNLISCFEIVNNKVKYG